MMSLKVLLTTQRYFSCFAPRFHYSTTPLFHCTGAKENVVKRKRKGSIGKDDEGVKPKCQNLIRHQGIIPAFAGTGSAAYFQLIW